MEYDNKNKDGKDRTDDKGSIAELKGYLFTIGETDSSLHCVDTKTAVAEYCGRQWGQQIYDLILDGTDYEPAEPVKPSIGPATRSSTGTDASSATTTMIVDPFEMEKYKQDYAHYLKTKQRYEQDKGKAFVTMMGQCSQRLKRRRPVI